MVKITFLRVNKIFIAVDDVYRFDVADFLARFADSVR